MSLILNLIYWTHPGLQIALRGFAKPLNGHTYAGWLLMKRRGSPIENFTFIFLKGANTVYYEIGFALLARIYCLDISRSRLGLPRHFLPQYPLRPTPAIPDRPG